MESNVALLAGPVLTIETGMAIASVAVGVVFAYAAAAKLLNMERFVAGVRGYQAIPSRLAPTVAGLLVAGEGFIALAHLVGFALRLVVPATIALLLVFFIVMTYSLMRGEERPCLCFGVRQEDLVDMLSLTRVMALLAVEVSLLAYLLGGSGRMAIGAGDVYSTSLAVATAVLAVVLSGWVIGLPKLFRAWRVVRS